MSEMCINSLLFEMYCFPVFGYNKYKEAGSVCKRFKACLSNIKGMNRMNLSLKQYRAVDLSILLFILAAAEALISVAAGKWFPGELYVLSPTVAVTAIVMMRWGAYAALHAFGGGLAYCIASGASPKQFAVYCLGNCFALAALPLLLKLKKERVRSGALLTALYTAAVFCAVQIGRWLVGLCFGGTAGDIVSLFAADSLSLVFALVTVQIARRTDGLFEDQIAYLIRTQAERRKADLPDGGDTEYGNI